MNDTEKTPQQLAAEWLQELRQDLSSAEKKWVIDDWLRADNVLATRNNPDVSKQP